MCIRERYDNGNIESLLLYIKRVINGQFERIKQEKCKGIGA